MARMALPHTHRPPRPQATVWSNRPPSRGCARGRLRSPPCRDPPPCWSQWGKPRAPAAPSLSVRARVGAVARARALDRPAKRMLRAPRPLTVRAHLRAGAPAPLPRVTAFRKVSTSLASRSA